MGLKKLIGSTTGWGCFKDGKNRTGIILQKMAEIASVEKEEGYFKVQALFFELINDYCWNSPPAFGRPLS